MWPSAHIKENRVCAFDVVVAHAREVHTITNGYGRGNNDKSHEKNECNEESHIAILSRTKRHDTTASGGVKGKRKVTPNLRRVYVRS